jgi:hypothetical protein
MELKTRTGQKEIVSVRSPSDLPPDSATEYVIEIVDIGDMAGKSNRDLAGLADRREPYRQNDDYGNQDGQSLC